ncbi:MAG: AbrB/MazE/SpoVT family DNA-binding domain-containing protein [Armatimonadota bacterium]|nr:AbrB/MazE/SpoVT family DNA-binding domain-containing protein [Armatimonadota bacterium]
MGMSQTIVTIDSEGRICLPATLRESLSWKEGTPLKVEVLSSGQLLLHPLGEEPLLVEKDGVLVVRSRASTDLEEELERLRAERMHNLTRLSR